MGIHASSNATCLWQTILWADGYLDTASDIDGVFGTETYNATRAWQAEYDLEVDGSVGKESFAKTDDFLVKTGGSDAAGQALRVEFLGYAHNFDLIRGTDGNYEFVDGDGAWWKAGYNYRSCSGRQPSQAAEDPLPGGGGGPSAR